MKKNYFLKIFALSLMMMGFANLLFAQTINLPFQSDFSAVAGASVNSSSNMPEIKTPEKMPTGFLLTGAEKIYEAGQKLKFGTGSAVGVLPTAPINTAGATYIQVTFNALGWPTAAKTAKIVLTYGEQTAEFTAQPGNWPVTNADLVEFSCQFTALSTPTSLFFKTLTNTGSNESRFFLDDVRIIASNVDQVAPPTFNPPAGMYTTPQNVTISCATEGATIHYTTDGTAPTTSSPVFSSPIPVSGTTTIKAFAVKGELNPSTTSVAEYVFVESITTLAALRALAPAYNGGQNAGEIIYKFTGQAVITQKSIGGANNNLKYFYIQDATAAIMIFDPSAKISWTVGDKIENISGTLTNYFGMLEIIPNSDCDFVDFNQHVPTTVITASQLNYDYTNPIQAKIVTIKGVTYTQTGAFEAEKFYNIKEGSATLDSVIFTENKEADYIKDAIPTILVDITGVCNFKGGKDITTRNRIVPLDKGNNVPLLGITDLNKSTIKLSPNPADNYVSIVTNSKMKLEIYSLLGNLISIESLNEGSNTISVSQYPSGMYLMKLTDSSTGQSYIQKLVVK